LQPRPSWAFPPEPRTSIKQHLARSLVRFLRADNEHEVCFFPLTGRCSIDIEVERRQVHKGSNLGFNVGGEITRFVNDVVGLGGHVRYSRGGTLRFDGLEARDDSGRKYRTKVGSKTGGVTAGLSLRLRF
jgi:hypothetical protein